MAENKKSLVKFNIKNIKYALQNDDNFSTPILYGSGSAKKISLETDSSTKKIYGDGRVIVTLVNDKGKTGTITTNIISNDYEIAMGRKVKTTSGIADIQQHKNILHCIYFETEAIDANGKKLVAKTWLYGVTSSRPSEAYDQTTDDINESSFDTPLEIRGIPLRNADNEMYKDELGNEIYVWQMTVLPNDANYETFGDAVVLPTISN